MEYKTCCITGHRDLPASQIQHIRNMLQVEVASAIADGYTTFLSGFAEGTDLLFAEVVLELASNDDAIKLEAILPYPGRKRHGGARFQELLARCSEVHIVNEKYTPDCYHKRNRYMVDRSARVIAVYDGRSGGGTLYTMRYATEMGRALRVLPLPLTNPIG